MSKWSISFLIIAIVAGIFGFTGVASGTAAIAQTFFGVFLFLFVGSLVLGYYAGFNKVST